MTDVLTIKGSPVAAHEATYKHDNLMSDAQKAAFDNVVGTPSSGNPVVLVSDLPEVVEGFDPSFGAGLYLDLSETPTNGGTAVNKGVFGSNADFSIIGSAWTKTDTANGGHYWTKGDANVGGLRQKALVDINTATAAYVSHSSTNIVIDDTANDLQALFQQNALAITKRRFKVVMRQNGSPNKCASAYVGAISKSTNRYTITVHTTADGSSNAWNGDSITGALTYWGIYFAELDYTTGLLTGIPEGMTIGLWYYAADPTVDYPQLFSNWEGYVDAARSCQLLIQQAPTNGSILLGQRNNSNTQADVTTTCLTQNRWHAIIARFRNGASCQLSMNGGIIAVDDGSCASGLVTVHGVSFGCQPVSDGVPLPNSSRIAYPTIWRSILPATYEVAWYHYHKNLLGLQDNH